MACRPNHWTVPQVSHVPYLIACFGEEIVPYFLGLWILPITLVWIHPPGPGPNANNKNVNIYGSLRVPCLWIPMPPPGPPPSPHLPHWHASTHAHARYDTTCMACSAEHASLSVRRAVLWSKRDGCWQPAPVAASASGCCQWLKPCRTHDCSLTLKVFVLVPRASCNLQPT
jgi:hypothetical protein